MRREIRRGRRRARRRLRAFGLRVDFAVAGAAAGVAVVLALAALLHDRRERADVEDLVAYARERRVEPIELILAAGRAHRIVFLGDVHRAHGPKRLAADAIEALARGPGLDVVVLEVAADGQAAIDAYLAREPEDASILFARPEVLHESRGVAWSYLEIYRRVRALNREFGPERRIRVIAADLPGWPPARRLPPSEAARRFARRDAHMADVVERDVHARDPGARVLVFMGGYHGLKDGPATLRFAGGAPVEVTWLATRLARAYPGQVFTILPDGAAAPADGVVAAYRATRAFTLLRRNLPDAAGPFALPVNDRFDFLTAPILEFDIPGLHLALGPDGYRLRDVVDGYVWLGR